MDVGQISISISTPWPAYGGEKTLPVNNNTISSSIAGLSEKNFDYNQVMMDLEEVKSFLYMVVGGGSLRVKQGEKVGANVDKLA